MSANINHHFVSLGSGLGRAATFGPTPRAHRGEKIDSSVVNEKFSEALWSDFSSFTVHLPPSPSTRAGIWGGVGWSGKTKTRVRVELFSSSGGHHCE